MNWLLIIVLLFLAWNIVYGYQKGFLWVVYSLVEWILVLVFVTWATPYVSDALVKYTPIQSVVEQRCETYIQNTIKDAASSDVDSLKLPDDQTLLPEGMQGLELQLPPAVVKKLMSGGDLADQVMEQTGAYEKMAKNLASLIIKGISYLLVLIITGIVFFWVRGALKIISKIPILHGINKTFGIAAGALKGFLIVWVFFAFVAFFSTTSIGKSVIPYIYEAPLLTWLYQNNFILSIVMAFI